MNPLKDSFPSAQHHLFSCSQSCVLPVSILPSHPLQNPHRWGMREDEKKPFGMCLSDVEVGANQAKSFIHTAVPVLNKGL